MDNVEKLKICSSICICLVFCLEHQVTDEIHELNNTMYNISLSEKFRIEPWNQLF
jgi:hypothetical protein